MNILEDARIEKFVKRKYPGSVNLFKKGYAALAARDFFGIANEGVNSCNLIDRINLFFKGQDGVEFSDEEKVFVDRADKLETEDEVLDLAEELYKYMEDNPETDKQSDGKTVGNGESAPSDTGDSGGKSSEESGDTSDDLRSTDDPTVDNSGSNVGDDDGDDDGDAASGSAGDSDDAGDDTESGADTSEGSEVGGNDTSSAPAGVPVKTDKALSDALKSLVDGNANEKVYGRIPKVDSSEFIVDYKTVVMSWVLTIPLMINGLELLWVNSKSSRMTRRRL